MPFAVVVLSPERKFLSRRVCLTPVETGQYVADLLQKDLVGHLSIQREKPTAKESE